jgi:hypothetical protein
MNYIRLYTDLIERAKSRLLEKPYEIHHIRPKCLGGGNEEENLVKLTPEEHYVAHQILVKIHPNNCKIIFAATAMAMSRPNMPRNNKTYGWLVRLASKAKTGVKFTDERKANISRALQGRKAPNKLSWEELSYSTQCTLFSKKDERVPKDWKPIKVRGTVESNKRISDGQKGKKLTAEHRANIGRPKTEEQKRIQSEKIKQVRANKFWSTKKLD